MNPNKTNQMVQDTLTSKNNIKRILYATDLTQTAPRVYQYVLNLAKQFNTEIVCLHVIDKFLQSSTMTFAMYYLTKDDKQEILNRERNTSLERMAHRNCQSFICKHLGIEDGLYPEQLGLTIVNEVVFGDVEEQILKHSVDSNCDLIVMGAHEKPFFTFTKTLSERVVKRSKVPVTIVPIPSERKERPTGFLPSFLPQFSKAG